MSPVAILGGASEKHSVRIPRRGRKVSEAAGSTLRRPRRGMTAVDALPEVLVSVRASPRRTDVQTFARRHHTDGAGGETFANPLV